jgi:phosphoenolpyruvate synthase/pyruvate phosphate dikinase
VTNEEMNDFVRRLDDLTNDDVGIVGGKNASLGEITLVQHKFSTSTTKSTTERNKTMNKDTYVEKLKARLDEWNADLDKLHAKAREATADQKLQFEKQMESVRARKDEVKQKLSEIQSAGENAWEQVKEGTDDAWNRLKEAVSKAKSELE